MPRFLHGPRVLVLASILACAAAGEPKGVDVSLRVKWPGTSYLLEAAEYLVSAIVTNVSSRNCESAGTWAPANACVFACSQAAESPSAFWSFIEAWQNPVVPQASCWDAIFSSARQHVSSELALSLQQAMSSRQYTAKVEMLRNLGQATEVLLALA